jgi:hypothetical protein
VLYGTSLSRRYVASLAPRGEEYFRRTREKSFGKAMEDIVPKGKVAVAEWAKFKDGMRKVDVWHAKNSGKGLFLPGETPSWVDIVIASYLVWMRIVWGEDNQKWKDISSWNNGRWAGLVEALRDYETAV